MMYRFADDFWWGSASSAPQQLLRFADAGLYAAKRAGRNRVSLNSDCPA